MPNAQQADKMSGSYPAKMSRCWRILCSFPANPDKLSGLLTTRLRRSRQNVARNVAGTVVLEEKITSRKCRENIAIMDSDLVFGNHLNPSSAAIQVRRIVSSGAAPSGNPLPFLPHIPTSGVTEVSAATERSFFFRLVQRLATRRESRHYCRLCVPVNGQVQINSIKRILRHRQSILGGRHRESSSPIRVLPTISSR